MAYLTLSENPISEKNVVAHIEPSQKLVTFNLSGDAADGKYFRDVDYFVIGVKNGTTAFTKVGSSSLLVANSFFFDKQNKRLWVKLAVAEGESDPQNPNAAYIVATYRLFFSDTPLSLTHDLTSSGFEVEYQPSIKSTSSFPQEISSDEQIGIALESNGSINFINTDGYFDDKFDKLIFENKNISIYSIFLSKPVVNGDYDNKFRLFNGLIENKKFDPNSVSFRLKDQMFKLRQKLDNSLFTSSDGQLSDDFIDKPKRLIYGKVNGLKPVGLDKVLDGYSLSGTISLSTADVNISGVTFTSGNEEHVTSHDIKFVHKSRFITGSNVISNVNVGDWIRAGDDNPSWSGSANTHTRFYEVEDIVDSKHLKIKKSWKGGTEPGHYYDGEWYLRKAIVISNTDMDGQIFPGDKFTITNSNGDTDTHEILKVEGKKITLTKPFQYGFTAATPTFNQAHVVVGSGTDFLSKVVPTDEIFFTSSGVEYRFEVQRVLSDTKLLLGEKSTISFSGQSFSLSPNRSPYYKNRVWHLSGHKLREPSMNLTAIVNESTVTVASPNDFFEGDTITITEGSDSFSTKIKRIDYASGEIQLNQVTSFTPTTSAVIKREPIILVNYQGKDFDIARDITISNTSNDCKITFSNDAEFNITKEIQIEGVAEFFNGSNEIEGIDTNFTEDLRPGDWIKGPDITHTTYYRIVEIEKDDILRVATNYTGTSVTGKISAKKVDYFEDSSSISISCYGKENTSGKWIKTASDAVEDLLSQASITNLNTASFTAAKVESNHILSLKLPLSFGSDSPTIRDAIKPINNTVFGSLFLDENWDINYSILSAEKPTSLSELKDDDIISFSVTTKTDIKRKVNSKYDFRDNLPTEDESSSTLISFTSTFVDNLIGINNEENNNLYLIDSNDAETICQRYSIINSLTQSIVSVKAKLNLVTKKINDKLYVSLDRLYKRFGSSDARKKIGIVNRVNRGVYDSEIRFTDLGNIFNRVGAIADNTSVDFTSETESNIILKGYICDNTNELPSSSPSNDDEWGVNLIG